MNDDTRSALIENIGRALEAGDIMEAAGIAQELLAETRRLGNPPDASAATLLSLIGNVLADRGFAASALDTLAEADAEWARYPDESSKLLWLARNAQFQALALRALGRHPESIAASELALSSYRAAILGDDDPVAVVPETALALIDHVAADMRAVDAESAEICGTVLILLVRVCSNLARTHLAIGQVFFALPWLDILDRAIDRVGPTQRSFVLIEAFSAHSALVLTLMMLSETGAANWMEDNLPDEIQRAIGRYEALAAEEVDLTGLPGAESFENRMLIAQRSFCGEEAHDLLTTMLADFGDDEFKRATTFVSLASIELVMEGDLDEAERKAGEALKVAEWRPEDGKFLLCSSQVLLAEVCLRRGAFEDAKRWAALSIIGMLRISAEGAPLGDPLRQLAVAYRALGNPAASVFFAKCATGVNADIHRRIERAVPLMSSKELPSGHEQTADRLREYLIEDGRLGEALTAGLLPMESELPPTTPTESEFARRFSDSALAVEDIDRFTRDLASAEARHAADRERLQQEQLERFRAVVPGDNGTTFLHLNPRRDHLQVVLATFERTEHRSIPVPAKALAKSTFDFLEALVNESAYMDDLYALLIRPIEEQLGGTRRLVIAAADFLRFLPFAALCDGGNYLVEHYAIVSWSPIAAPLLKTLPRSHAHVALFGYAQGGGSHEELETVPEELSAIAAACRSTRRAVVSESHLDGNFRAETLAAAFRADVDVMHLATHFDADSADAAKAHLVLGDDTLMDLSDLAGYAAQGTGADLITLAACSTGLLFARAAEINVSAAAALHASGTRSVVSTLWSVHSASTTLLMERFYRALFATEIVDKAEALRQAQLALLRGSRAYSHPHHWAPFVLSGNWLPFPAA